MLSIIIILLLAVAGGKTQDEYPDYGWDETTLLDEYVWEDDGAWTWEILDIYRYEEQEVDLYVLNMTSQRWMDEESSSHTLWWHWMGVAVPDQIDFPEHAIVFNVGGNNRDPDNYPNATKVENVMAARMAGDTKTICAHIMQNPNGPIDLRGGPEDRPRTSDDLIAYTWMWWLDRFERGLNPPEQVMMRFPMTKAAKVGFDTVIALADQERPETNIQYAVVGGPSKRGWTAWSHAYTDQRVVATIPLVFSLLKMREGFMNHYMAMGGHWSWAMSPYYINNITRVFLDDNAEYVINNEDVWYYRSRLADIPKLCISATGDEWFFPADYHSWWQEYPGDMKWLMMTPNSQHILFPQWLQIYRTIVGWYLTLVNRGADALPKIGWERIDETEGEVGRIEMTSNIPADDVRGMRAVTLENSTYRDFRLIGGYPEQSLQPIWWNEYDVETIEDDDAEESQYMMEVPYVEDEWVGFMIEGTWITEEGWNMTFTTEVQIVPDDFPVGPCEDGDSCYSSMV